MQAAQEKGRIASLSVVRRRNEVRAVRVLRGFRRAKPADGAALRQLLLQVSDLVVKHPEIDEPALSPVIVHERGLSIVDARIVFRASG